MNDVWKGPPVGGAGIREFSTGAKRDTDVNKLDFEGFVCPRVLEAFGQYMNFNRRMQDGSTRESDNWQKGIPLPQYMKSGWRHFFDWFKEHRGIRTKEGIVLALLGLIFNAQGYLHELLKEDPGLAERAMAQAEAEREKRWSQPQ